MEVEKIDAFWGFIKKFTQEVGGALPAAALLMLGVFLFLAYKKPENTYNIFKQVLQYFFGMFFHPLIIQRHIDEQQKLRNEVIILRTQVSNFEKKLNTILRMLAKNKISDEVMQEIFQELEKD
jgi:hypothetical protein